MRLYLWQVQFYWCLPSIYFNRGRGACEKFNYKQTKQNKKTFRLQFQIFRKLSQDPVATAIPSSVTPRQLTRLSCPANTPEIKTADFMHKHSPQLAAKVRHSMANSPLPMTGTRQDPRHLPARSAFSVSHTLQLKSSYPARSRRPLFENATEVMPQMMLSWE